MRCVPLALLALALGCGEPAAAPAAVEPPAPLEPAPERADPRCLALCEHGGACLDARGEPRTEDERDCAVSCRDGLYAAMPETALACSAQDDCDALRECLGTAFDAMLGAPTTPAPEPTVLPAPSAWPEGFPTIPGGTPLPTSGDPLTLARVAYAGTPEGLESLLRGELARAGWAVDPSTADDGAVRFFARRHDIEIGVAVYRESPERSVVQLVGFGVPATAP